MPSNSSFTEFTTALVAVSSTIVELASRLPQPIEAYLIGGDDETFAFSFDPDNTGELHKGEQISLPGHGRPFQVVITVMTKERFLAADASLLLLDPLDSRN